MIKNFVLIMLGMAVLTGCGVKGNLKPTKEMQDRLDKSGRPVPTQYFE